MRSSILELVDRQNEVIKLQADIIGELYSVLSQHMAVDDALEEKVIVSEKLRKGVEEVMT